MTEQQLTLFREMAITFVGMSSHTYGREYRQKLFDAAFRLATAKDAELATVITDNDKKIEEIARLRKLLRETETDIAALYTTVHEGRSK